MKKHIYIFSLISITFFSCQDVIDVDLETAQERLVIEAMITWERGTNGNEQEIKLSKTSSYYNNKIIKATGAMVHVTNLVTLQTFDFIEVEDGLYTTAAFEPVLNTMYELEVVYNNETYKATETLYESPEINDITQSTEEGFSTDEPEINVFFDDFENQDDFYRIVFQHFRPSTEVIDTDAFTFDSRFEENNELSKFYESEDLITGDELTTSILKVSKQFYTFINVIEAQGSDGGPFAPPPVNVKGNCINTTKESHYPYGYFGLNQISVGHYTFE